MEELFVSYVSHFIDAGTEEMLLRHLAVGAAVDERWDGTPGPQAPRLLMLREMLEWQGVTPESVQDALVAAVAAESGARDAAVTAAALATVGTTHDGDDARHTVAATRALPSAAIGWGSWLSSSSTQRCSVFAQRQQSRKP